MKKGQLLEITLRIVQESLKDKSDTQIFSNYKLQNESGNKREFDIVIKSTLNNFELLTVIECKDFTKPVPVEKIEAFQSKCLRIPTINKKVFVSRNGFQSDALNASKSFGIEIYRIEEINQSLVTEWLAVSMITPAKASLIINNLVLKLNPFVDKPNFSMDSIIYKNSKTKLANIQDYINGLINKSGIFNKRMVLQAEGMNINREEKYSIEFKPTEELFLFDSSNCKYRITEFIIWVSIIIEELKSKVTVERIISDNNEMSTVITHDSNGPDIIKLVLKDSDPNEFVPFMINKESGEIFDTGCSFKYEKIKE